MTLQPMYAFNADPVSGRAPRAWPRFMTARVAADYADASRWTIRRYVRPCGRRGRSFIYAIEAIEDWMRGLGMSERGAVGSDAKPPRLTRGSQAQIRDLATIDPRVPRVAARDEHVAA